MNIAQIEENLQNLMKNLNKESFVFDLLLAYGTPKSMIARMQKGTMNLAKEPGEVLLKTKLHFKEVKHVELHGVATELVRTGKHDPRFVVVTDYKNLVAIDTKTLDKLDIALKTLPKHFDFFLPWAGMEKAQHANENPADVKAAERMAKLFDAIKKENPDDSPEFIHGLNVFLSRLLFCYFAEDTNIFAEGQFTNAISSHTQPDGSDLHTYLDTLFDVLNTPANKRKKLPDYLNKFPYVNGGLFRKHIAAPMFTRRSRQVIIDAGELVWSAINPDIFGSMFQAVIGADQRGTLGQHYTSVPNIMKVIEPLFLNELKEAFESAKGSTKKLNDLLARIAKIKIFDPACGSGNFLIIAYKELRRLEMQIFEELNRLAKQQASHFTQITLDQFYGIEIDDFAHEIALLSLWLAEHQMNVEFFKAFGNTTPTLPLKETGNIVQGNACRLNWEKVCPKGKEDEVYVLGNPPYLGDKMQSKDQKEDLALVFVGQKDMKALDYIAAWFMKASRYISSTSMFAFVTTNSLNQGVQVPLLWPQIFANGQEIRFAFPSFPWTNGAKNKAAVICSIIGVGPKDTCAKKYLFLGSTRQEVDTINAYLVGGRDIIVEKLSTSISRLPLMTNGNIPRDQGYFMLDNEERLKLETSHPEIIPCIKRIVGSSEFLNDIHRWCLWIEDDQSALANSVPEVRRRLELIRDYRINGSERGKLGIDTPYRFERTLRCKELQLVIPRVSSERRNYIPVGYLNRETIISDAALVVFDPELYILSILSSSMHMVWVKILAGRLKSDFRYSVGLCYNSFPFPPITQEQKDEITRCTFRILEIRELYPERTLAELYDPDKMPADLREAHLANDIVIERCYRPKPFTSDEERLEYLFKLYEKMIAQEQGKK